MHPNTALKIVIRHGWSRLIDTGQEWTQRGICPASVLMPFIPPMLVARWGVHRTIVKTQNPRSLGVSSSVALNLDLLASCIVLQLFLGGLHPIYARSTDMASMWRIANESAYLNILLVVAFVFFIWRCIYGNVAQSWALTKMEKPRTFGNLLIYRPWVVVFLFQGWKPRGTVSNDLVHVPLHSVGEMLKDKPRRRSRSRHGNGTSSTLAPVVDQRVTPRTQEEQPLEKLLALVTTVVGIAQEFTDAVQEQSRTIGVLQADFREVRVREEEVLRTLLEMKAESLELRAELGAKAAAVTSDIDDVREQPSLSTLNPTIQELQDTVQEQPRMNGTFQARDKEILRIASESKNSDILEARTQLDAEVAVTASDNDHSRAEPSEPRQDEAAPIDPEKEVLAQRVAELLKQLQESNQEQLNTEEKFRKAVLAHEALKMNYDNEIMEKEALKEQFRMEKEVSEKQHCEAILEKEAKEAKLKKRICKLDRKNAILEEHHSELFGKNIVDVSQAEEDAAAARSERDDLRAQLVKRDRSIVKDQARIEDLTEQLHEAKLTELKMRAAREADQDVARQNASLQWQLGEKDRTLQKAEQNIFALKGQVGRLESDKVAAEKSRDAAQRSLEARRAELDRRQRTYLLLERSLKLRIDCYKKENERLLRRLERQKNAATGRSTSHSLPPSTGRDSCDRKGKTKESVQRESQPPAVGTASHLSIHPPDYPDSLATHLPPLPSLEISQAYDQEPNNSNESIPLQSNAVVSKTDYLHPEAKIRSDGPEHHLPSIVISNVDGNDKMIVNKSSHSDSEESVFSVNRPLRPLGASHSIGSQLGETRQPTLSPSVSLPEWQSQLVRPLSIPEDDFSLSAAMSFEGVMASSPWRPFLSTDNKEPAKSPAVSEEELTSSPCRPRLSTKTEEAVDLMAISFDEVEANSPCRPCLSVETKEPAGLLAVSFEGAVVSSLRPSRQPLKAEESIDLLAISFEGISTSSPCRPRTVVTVKEPSLHAITGRRMEEEAQALVFEKAREKGKGKGKGKGRECKDEEKLAFILGGPSVHVTAHFSGGQEDQRVLSSPETKGVHVQDPLKKLGKSTEPVAATEDVATKEEHELQNPSGECNVFDEDGEDSSPQADENDAGDVLSTLTKADVPVVLSGCFSTDTKLGLVSAPLDASSSLEFNAADIPPQFEERVADWSFAGLSDVSSTWSMPASGSAKLDWPPPVGTSNAPALRSGRTSVDVPAVKISEGEDIQLQANEESSVEEGITLPSSPPSFSDLPAFFDELDRFKRDPGIDFSTVDEDSKQESEESGTRFVHPGPMEITNTLVSTMFSDRVRDRSRWGSTFSSTRTMNRQTIEGILKQDKVQQQVEDESSVKLDWPPTAGTSNTPAVQNGRISVDVPAVKISGGEDIQLKANEESSIEEGITLPSSPPSFSDLSAFFDELDRFKRDPGVIYPTAVEGYEHELDKSGTLFFRAIEINKAVVTAMFSDRVRGRWASTLPSTRTMNRQATGRVLKQDKVQQQVEDGSSVKLDWPPPAGTSNTPAVQNGRTSVDVPAVKISEGEDIQPQANEESSVEEGITLPSSPPSFSDLSAFFDELDRFKRDPGVIYPTAIEGYEHELDKSGTLFFRAIEINKAVVTAMFSDRVRGRWASNFSSTRTTDRQATEGILKRWKDKIRQQVEEESFVEDDSPESYSLRSSQSQLEERLGELDFSFDPAETSLSFQVRMGYTKL